MNASLFRSEKRAIVAERKTEAEVIGKEVDRWFEDRPDERIPGRYEEVFNYLAGQPQNLTAISDAMAEKRTAAEKAAATANPSPTPSSPAGEAPKEEGPSLTPQEKAVADKTMAYIEDKKERYAHWAEIRDNPSKFVHTTASWLEHEQTRGY